MLNNAEKSERATYGEQVGRIRKVWPREFPFFSNRQRSLLERVTFSTHRQVLDSHLPCRADSLCCHLRDEC